MNTPKTSKTHPLRIDAVRAQGYPGRIGMTLCPGKTDLYALSGAWTRDLDLDLDVIKAWGASAILSLMETHEFGLLGVPGFGDAVRCKDMSWYHLPIMDGHAPGLEFESAWDRHEMEIRNLISNGDDIVVHCRGGLGRTGVVAARILIELGAKPTSAVADVRRSREGTIENNSQLSYVLALTGQESSE